MRKLALLVFVMAGLSQAAVITGGYIDVIDSLDTAFKFTGPDNLYAEGTIENGPQFPPVTPVPYAKPPGDSFGTADFVASFEDGGLVGYLGHASLLFFLTGPTVYAPGQTVVSTTFSLTGDISADPNYIEGSIPGCVFDSSINPFDCIIPLTATGTVTYTWSPITDPVTGAITGYGLPKLAFVFDAVPNPLPEIPEPSTWFLVLGGVLAIGVFRFYPLLVQRVSNR
jgi:hypothetical protein